MKLKRISLKYIFNYDGVVSAINHKLSTVCANISAGLKKLTCMDPQLEIVIYEKMDLWIIQTLNVIKFSLMCPEAHEVVRSQDLR